MFVLLSCQLAQGCAAGQRSLSELQVVPKAPSLQHRQCLAPAGWTPKIPKHLQGGPDAWRTPSFGLQELPDTGAPAASPSSPRKTIGLNFRGVNWPFCLNEMCHRLPRSSPSLENKARLWAGGTSIPQFPWTQYPTPTPTTGSAPNRALTAQAYRKDALNSNANPNFGRNSTKGEVFPTKPPPFSPQGALTSTAQRQLFSCAKSHRGTSSVTSAELGRRPAGRCLDQPSCPAADPAGFVSPPCPGGEISLQQGRSKRSVLSLCIRHL